MLEKLIKKSLSGFLLFLFVFSAAAQSLSNTKIVRIGWYQSAKFQEGQSDSEPKSGYCYEYLNKVSDYNGWQYEFEYGDWSELFKMLEEGKIDILGGVSKTAERLEKMSFPNSPMGNDYYYLFQHSDDKKMNPSDLNSFNGCRIGGVKNNRMTYFLENWAKENGVKFEMVYYDGFAQRDEDFQNHKIDGISATDNNVYSTTGYSPVVKVGDEPYYLAVTKKRPDLLFDLNRALEMLQEMDPYFLQNIQYIYYGTTITKSQLSVDEQKWVDEHKVLRVGCLDDYLPYCKKDKNGNVYGLITDVFSAAFQALGITDKINLEYVPYESYDAMTNAVRIGEVDAAFPIGGSIWEIDQDGMYFTTSVITAGMDLVYKGSYTDKVLSKIAVNKNNKLQLYYVKSNFNDSRIIKYDSIEECLSAVKREDVGATVINGLRSNLVRNNGKYSNFSTLQLEANDNRYVGVKVGNSTLLLLLNRGIKLIGRDFAVNSSYKYIDEFYTFSTLDFIRKHFFAIFIIVLAIVLLVVYFLIRDAKKSRQKAEEEMQLNAKLEAAKTEAENANKAKTTFLFNMSHDIRTPMNAIIGFTNLIEKYYDDKEKSMDYLQKVQKSSDFLLSLVNNVLEMTRIESGKATVDETVCDSFEIIDEFYMMFEDQMKKKNLTFTKNVDIKTRYIFGDAAKIREIYLNLISNAYKYTLEGGNVTVEFTELPCEKKGYTVLEGKIIDSGIGMSEEFLSHLYEEFSRARTATESRVEGTGLGMAIVKRLVDLMGGTITVESEVNKGTTFTVRLTHKISDESAFEEDEKAVKKDVNFVGKRILLAEDNDLNAEISTEILSSVGFEIERAEDGLVCLDMLQNASDDYYDLILMDIQMPNLDGYKTTAAIRRMENLTKRNIPIIAMTANAFEEDKRDAMKAGMNGHVGKPIDVAELMKNLSVFLG